MKPRRHRSAPLPPPELREFLDALAAMLADAVLRDEAEAAKSRAASPASSPRKTHGILNAEHRAAR